MNERLKKILPKIAFAVASHGLQYGEQAFLATKPDAKSVANKLALQLASWINLYFSVDKDLAYTVIQAEIPRIKLEWFNDTADISDDNEEFLKVLGDILQKAIDVKPGLKSAVLQTVVPLVVKTVELQPGSTFVVTYSTDDELAKIKEKFKGTATLQ